MWKKLLFGSLLVFLFASLVLASGHWELGRYQLVNGPPYNGPLQARMTGRESLSSYGFVGKVGGVAFGGVAEPGPALSGKPIRLVYEKSKPDGQRLGIQIGQESLSQSLPDWILIPVARYANSEYNACVSLFGPRTTEQHYDIVYHHAFKDTLLGMRLLQADILFIDIGEMWHLPRLNGKVILGAGELEPQAQGMKAAAELSALLKGETFQSWVLTDEGETIRVDLKDGGLQFLGLPYYYFWNSDFAEYEREIGRLKRQAEKLLASGDIAGHNRVVQQANGLEPKVHAITRLTEAMKKQRETIRSYNPPVYEAATKTMRYAAFFRYVQKSAPESWKIFLASLQGVTSQPHVETPVKWATGR